MKKIYYFAFIFISLFAFQVVRADNTNITINCPNTVNPNDILKCNINVTGIIVKKIKLDYYLSGASFNNLELSNGYSFVQNNSNIVINSNGADDQNIGILLLNSNSYGKVIFNINSIKVEDINNNIYSLPSIYISSKILSNNAYLSDLQVSISDIAFSKTKYVYNVETNKDSVNISASASSDYANISGVGTHKLNYGNNALKIIVASESGLQKTYTVNINRINSKNSDCSLKDLALTDGDIEFKKNVTLYNVSVDKNLKSLKVNAELSNSSSTFIDNYGPRIVKLNLGDNKVYIKSKSKDGSTCTYTLNITRGSDNSDDTTLKSLKISKGNLLFDQNTSEYIAVVGYDVKSIDVKAAANSSTSVIAISKPDELKVGENIITIKVTSEMKSIRTYSIKVIRKKYNNLNSNADLKELKVAGYKLKFTNKINNYTIITNRVSSINIIYKTSDENASVTIVGNNNLKNGSKIKIIVMAEDGTFKIYNIRVNQTLLVRKIMIIMYFFLFVLYLCVIYYKNMGVNNEKKIKTKSKR